MNVSFFYQKLKNLPVIKRVGIYLRHLASPEFEPDLFLQIAN